MRTILSRLFSLALIIAATSFTACDVEVDNPVSDIPSDAYGPSYSITPDAKQDSANITVEQNGTCFKGILENYTLHVTCDSITFDNFTLETGCYPTNTKTKIYIVHKATLNLIGDSHIYLFGIEALKTTFPISLQGDDASLTIHSLYANDVEEALQHFIVADGYIMGISMVEQIAPHDFIISFRLTKRKVYF